MKEKLLEKQVKKWVDEQCGIFFKNPPTVTGRFDFEFTLPSYRGVWVICETKSTYRKLTMEQAVMMSRLRENNCYYSVVRDFDDILRVHKEVLR